MADPESQDILKQFAADRSHKDAVIANETGRATGQAVILINGGAATAILAFLAKDKLDPIISQFAPWCLAGYAFGVISGACMLYFSTRAADAYGYFWNIVVQRGGDESIRIAASRWQKWMHRCFLLSVAAFFISSLGIAYILATSLPSQKDRLTSSIENNTRSAPLRAEFGE